MKKFICTFLCMALLLTGFVVPKASAAEPWVNNADISWIDSSKKIVAFTFDDGPVGTAPGVSSQRILDVMEKYKMHCTYFYWGEKINDSNLPELQRAYSLGCELGNHSFTHPYLTQMTASQITQEISKTNDLLSPISGNLRTLVRPPYGAVNQTMSQTIDAPLINWSLDSGDWNNGNYNSVLSKIRNSIRDGDIILFHQTYDFTAQAIETLVPELIEKGYVIVSVSELMKIKGVNLQAGTAYSNQALNKKNIETTFPNIAVAQENIAAIGEVTLESAAAVSGARAAYDALTDAQKLRVENYTDLTDAEATLKALLDAAAKAEADKAAAIAVEEKIAAIGTVTLESEAAIAAARAAYDALTDDQKALADLNPLTDAEAALKALQDAAAKAEADKAAAKAVEEKIAAIGTVTLESEAAIAAARAAYDALTDDQKALVDLNPLTDAEAALEELKNVLPFTDVSGWYEDAVRYVYRNKLMNGISATLFNPGGTLTRGQLVTILYRVAGSPHVDFEALFADVAAGRYYTAAVLWAVSEGMVTGYPDGSFRPDAPISREQIATILYRYAGSPAVSGSLAAFPDEAAVSNYAKSALLWATEKGLITGIKTGEVTRLAPKENATRAQIAAIFMRYLQAK